MRAILMEGLLLLVMYSKQEASQLKKAFWIVFGQYMNPVLSAEGEKISWLNYKTGEKNIFFRMEADNKKATTMIELTHNDAGIQQLYFEQFLQGRKLLVHATKNEWQWQLHIINESGKMVSRIVCELPQVSIFEKDDWPSLISFFKSNSLAFDQFWSQAKYGFEALR